MAKSKAKITECALRSILKSHPDCPCCKEVMLQGFPPLKCLSDHRICRKCFQSSIDKQCPVCNSQKSQKSTYEKKEGNVSNCRYEARGCTFIIPKGKAIPNHEIECKFRDYSCLGSFMGIFKCPWKGLQEGLIQHFENDHKQNFGNMSYKHTGFVNLNKKGDLQIFSAHNKQFIFVYQRKSPLPCSSYIYIACLGTEKQAAKFCYELEIYKPGDIVTTLKYREVCVSDSCPPLKVVENSNCIIICDNTFKNFFIKDLLHIRFWIKQVHEVVSAKINKKAK